MDHSVREDTQFPQNSQNLENTTFTATPAAQTFTVDANTALNLGEALPAEPSFSVTSAASDHSAVYQILFMNGHIDYIPDVGGTVTSATMDEQHAFTTTVMAPICSDAYEFITSTLHPDVVQYASSITPALDLEGGTAFQSNTTGATALDVEMSDVRALQSGYLRAA